MVTGALDRSTASDICLGVKCESLKVRGVLLYKLGVTLQDIVCSIPFVRSRFQTTKKKVSPKRLYPTHNYTNEIASYFVPKHETETRLAIRFFCPLKKRRVLEWLLAALHN